MHHDWMIGLFKKAIVHLPLSNCTSGNLMRPLGAPERGSRVCFADITMRNFSRFDETSQGLNGDGGVKKKGRIIINFTGN